MIWNLSAAVTGIVGDHLVLILTYTFSMNEGHPDDQVFIYKWKTGELKMVRDLQPASAPYLMLVRASLRHSVHILISPLSHCRHYFTPEQDYRTT